MAEQILFALNQKDKYLGAQLVTQPTMYYPTYVVDYENTFQEVLELYATQSLPPTPWKERITPFLDVGDYESVRDVIRSEYANQGHLAGEYVAPKGLLQQEKPMLWEGSAIISKRRILETGTIFMSKPDDCTDKNQRATQYISVPIDSSNSKLSPHSGVNTKHSKFYLFNTHFGLEPSCMRSEVQETIEYMNRLSGPTLLVGDFNAEPQTKAWNHFRKAGFTDIWQHLHHEHDDSIVMDEEVDGTCRFEGWCTFPSDNPIKRIDYAWGNAELKPHVHDMRLLGTNANNEEIFPSDHLGYLIKFNFTANKHHSQRFIKQDKNQLSPLSF